MRLFLLIALAATAAGAYLLLSAPKGTAPGDAQTIERRSDGVDAEAVRGGTPVLPDVGPQAATETDPSTLTELEMQARRSTGPPVTFAGAALLQREGDRPWPARIGTLEIAVLVRAEREERTLKLLGGRFETELPGVARVQLLGGTFDGEPVRFSGMERPFRPVATDYALVGTPIPPNVLKVMDSASGAPLTGITIRHSATQGAALVGESSASGKVILEDATSPVTLPWIQATHPIWLRVESPGHAGRTVLVDTNEARTQEVVLFPEAELTVRITGPGQHYALFVALVREEGEGRRYAAGQITLGTSTADEGLDGHTLRLRSLAGMPHTVMVKGRDRRGVLRDLATERVDLLPGDAKSMNVYLEAP